MSNIRKIAVFVIFIVVFLSPVFAEEKQSGFRFSVTPSVGVINGQANEIVYKDSYSGMFESELQWDMKPIIYAGLAADLGPANSFAKHGFVGNLSFKFGIPQRAGIMEDRDWQYENSGALTNYSRHDNFSERTITADLTLGYSFPLLNFMALGLNLDFSYTHFYWIAKNGYYQYLEQDDFGNILPGQTWTDDIQKVPMKGKLIEYSQNWFIFSPGVFIKLRLGTLFSLNGNFNYSPFIYCADRDEHLLRNTTFLDYLYYGHYLKGSGGITFSPLDYLDLTLFLSYSSITDSRGDTYINSVKYSGIAGGGYAAFELGFSARFRFFGGR